MVRAILDGRKTQTRRVVKLQGAEVIEERPRNDPDDNVLSTESWPWSPQHDGWVSCPYGRPGDRLWVRETWASLHPTTDAATAAAHRDRVVERPEDGERVALWYRADGEMPLVEQLWADDEDGIRWRPSVHMPRWASRITLEVTGVRVERLQDITEEDARAEGVRPYTSLGPYQRIPGPGFNGALLVDQPHRLPFADLWRDINGPDAWDTNPWVWVINFRRCTP
jgi:hypothetical protein